MAFAKMLNLEKQKSRIAKSYQAARDAADRQLNIEVPQLVEAIRRAAPEKTGVLKSSIGARPTDGRELAYTIYAGGKPTTKKIRSRKVSAGRGKTQGVSDADFAKALESGGNKGEFDYSRADEFGHRTPDGKHVPAKPFFYVTYRARKRGMRRRLAAAPLKAAKAAFSE